MTIDGGRLLLVGSYPPPYGGNSVHVARLRAALADRYRVEVIDAYGAPRADDDDALRRCGRGLSRAFALVAALRGSRAGIAHVHVSALRAFLWVAVPFVRALPRDAARVLTIHGGSFVPAFATAPRWKRRLLRFVLERFDRIVVVGEAQRRFAIDLGIDARRVAVVPAFLPPVARETARARAVLADLGACRNAHERTAIVVTSGRARPYYGFHVLLDAVARLAPQRRPPVLICTYDASDDAYVADLSARRDVRCAIVRDLEPAEFAWLLSRAACYVRATDRDGDAVAIREARHFGTPTIASDCVARPAGTATFATGDASALAVALERLDDESSVARAAGAPAADEGEANLAALRAIYADARSHRSRLAARRATSQSPI